MPSILRGPPSLLKIWAKTQRKITLISVSILIWPYLLNRCIFLNSVSIDNNDGHIQDHIESGHKAKMVKITIMAIRNDIIWSWIWSLLFIYDHSLPDRGETKLPFLSKLDFTATQNYKLPRAVSNSNMAYTNIQRKIAIYI